MNPRTLKNVNCFKSYLEFMKTLKFGLFLPYFLQNLTKRLHSGLIFKENFDGIQFIKRTNFITHRIKIKIILSIIKKQVVTQF